MRKRYAFQVVFYDRVSLDKAKSHWQPSMLKAWEDMKLVARAKNIEVPPSAAAEFERLRADMRGNTAWSRADITPSHALYCIEIVRGIA